MNAGRRYLGVDSLAGKVFVTAGLGGMSGAQPKAATIAGCISVTAEVGCRVKFFGNRRGSHMTYSAFGFRAQILVPYREDLKAGGICWLYFYKQYIQQ